MPPPLSAHRGDPVCAPARVSASVETVLTEIVKCTRFERFLLLGEGGPQDTRKGFVRLLLCKYSSALGSTLPRQPPTLSTTNHPPTSSRSFSPLCSPAICHQGAHWAAGCRPPPPQHCTLGAPVRAAETRGPRFRAPGRSFWAPVSSRETEAGGRSLGLGAGRAMGTEHAFGAMRKFGEEGGAGVQQRGGSHGRV